jgi:hypothetical protein
VATPTIATATRPFAAAITDGVDGVLVHDPEQWAPAIERLVTDGPERARLGAGARRSALLGWSPHRQGARMVEILRAVRDAPTSAPARRWDDVVVDEPAAPGPVPLTAYPAAEAADRPGPSASPAGTASPSLPHKLWWSLRHESPTTIAQRVVRRLRR